MFIFNSKRFEDALKQEVVIDYKVLGEKEVIRSATDIDKAVHSISELAIKSNNKDIDSTQLKLQKLRETLTTMGSGKSRTLNLSSFKKQAKKSGVYDNLPTETKTSIEKYAGGDTTFPTVAAKRDELQKISDGIKTVQDDLDRFRAEESDPIPITLFDSRELDVTDKRIESTIKQFENLKLMLETIANGNTDFTALRQSLIDTDLFEGLSKSSQDLLTSMSTIQTTFSGDFGAQNLKTVTEALGEVTDGLKEFADDYESAKRITSGEGIIPDHTVDEVREANKEFERMSKETNVLSTMLARLKSSFNGLDPKDLTSSMTSLFNSLETVKLTYLFRAVKRGTQYMADAVDKAAEYQESLNLYRMALGEYAGEASEWMEEISDKLMLDPSQMMQYTGGFYNLTKGMGVAKDAAFTMSQNLTQLTYDMASYLNISNEAAQAKIQSAMTGQSRAVASAGVAMQVASLQELALSMGIKKNVSEMTQAEKTYLRYIQLLKSTTHMQGDLARTIITPANAMRVLKQQLNLLARSFGEVFIPIIMKAIPVLMALAMVLKDVMNSLAALFGFELANVDFSVDSDKIFNFEDIEDGLDGIGGKADKTAKSINRMLAPFDDLNVVESLSGGKGSGSGGAGDTLDFSMFDKYIDKYDMLAGYTDDLKQQAEALIEPMKKILTIAGALWGAFKFGQIVKGFLDITSGIGNFIKAAAGTETVKAGLTKLAPVLKTLGKVAGFVGGILIVLGGMKDFDKTIENAKKGASDLESRLGMAKSFAEMAGGGALAGGAVGGPVGAIVGGVLGLSVALIKTIKVNNDLKNSVIDMSEGTKEAYNDIIPSVEGVEKAISHMHTTMKIDEATKKSIKDSVATLVGDIKKQLKKNADDEAKAINNLVSAGTMDEATAQGMLEKITKYHDAEAAETERIQSQINEILAKYGDDRSTITEEDMTRLLDLQTELENQVVEVVYDGAGYQTAILEDLKKRKTEISKEEASKVIKDALDTRDKTIAAAQTQYKETVAAANRLHEAGVINDEEYQSMVDAALKTRDETVSAANEQYNEIYSTFQKNQGDIARYIDKDTGKVKTKWDLMWEGIKTTASNIWDGIRTAISNGWSKITTWWGNNITPFFDSLIDFINPLTWATKIADLFNGIGNSLSKVKIKTPHISWDADHILEAPKWLRGALESLGLPTGIPKLKVDWYEDGGYPTSGDLFFANENGRAEFITSIGNKTAVANQDQMVQALTNAITIGFASLSMNNTPSTTIVNIGNRRVYEGQGEYQNRQADRYGTTSTITV